MNIWRQFKEKVLRSWCATHRARAQQKCKTRIESRSTWCSGLLPYNPRKTELWHVEPTKIRRTEQHGLAGHHCCKIHARRASFITSRKIFTSANHTAHHKKVCLGKREENSVNRSCSVNHEKNSFCPLQDDSIMETSNNILNDPGGHTLGLSESVCLLFNLSKLTNKGQNDNRSTSLISKSTIVTNRENVRLAEHGFDKQQI